MKLPIAIVFLCALLAAGCGAAPATAPESTPEVGVEATAEVVAGTPEWVSVTVTDPTMPGWTYQHPEGWQVLTLDPDNLFMISGEGINERLFVEPLLPGEIAIQISRNRAANPDETDAAHLAVLTDTIRGAEFSAPQPVTIAGLGGVQQIGVNDALNLTVIATSRAHLRGEFIDTFVYTRSDEYAANLPLIDAVMQTVRYVLATE